MYYRVYSGPKGSETLSGMAKAAALFKQTAGIDEALSWARHLEKSGRVALLIEGDDGISMDRREISALLAASRRDQVGD